MRAFQSPDSTYDLLQRYVGVTESMWLEVLRGFDPKASCSVTPSLDLGFPHNAVRLAGGFPTGVVISWSCSVPVVPIDATVNVCTVSVFKLTNRGFERLRVPRGLMERIEHVEALDMPFRLNFRRGNHFVSVCLESESQTGYLVVHSSATEFKDGASGLYPHASAWYAPRIQTHVAGDRYLRYVSHSDATLFTQIATRLQGFNEMRHEFLSAEVVGHPADLELVSHSHHYCMPDSQTIAIGSYLALPGSVVPMLTSPGRPIYMARVTDNPHNRISLSMGTRQMVPHGWGKTSTRAPSVEVDQLNSVLTVNDLEFPIADGSSLDQHPDLMLRQYPGEPDDPRSFFSRYGDFLGVEVTSRLDQVVSMSMLGVMDWSS